jgi:hypothetical protein
MNRNVVIDESNIQDVINAFKSIYNDIDKYVEKTNEKIIQESKKYLDKQYSSRLKDPNITDISTEYEKIDNGYKLTAKGKDVLYEEFGTGDRGEDDPHPDKSKFNLNDYNSGYFIMSVEDIGNQDLLDFLKEEGITSGKYWSYRKNGERHFTQGVPSGKEMWNTRNEMIKNIIPKAKKELGVELLDKFENAIKK